ncbi:MAG TPA: hypothetical protein VM899_04520 [Rubellimicrobium sp.]|nr:hypothetical protein [Rubellimicrobium sp.]
MFGCFPDPILASLLAGENDAMTDGPEVHWVLGALAVQILALLAAGAVPW